MNIFLDKFKEKIIETVKKLPYTDVERIVILTCNKAYINKLENEITNVVIRTKKISNHSKLSDTIEYGDVVVKLRINESFTEPEFKAAYYDKRSN